MKFFSKVAAILAALMLACAFVACSNDSSDSGSEKSVVATYTSASDGTVTFYSDNTVTLTTGSRTQTGTYTGNGTSGSGTIKGMEGGDAPYTISGNTLTITGGPSYTKQ